MNLVPNRGAPSFYLPGFPHSERKSGCPGFRPSSCVSRTSSSVPASGNLLFPSWSRRPPSSLVVFYRSRGEHGLPNFGRQLATAILWSFGLPVGSHHRLRHRSFDSRRQPHYPITVVVGTWMTFYKMSSSSNAQARGLCTARFELSPFPSTATVATWGRCFGANADGRLGFDCPRYTADTCISFRQCFQRWYLIPHRVHSLSDFFLSTTF